MSSPSHVPLGDEPPILQLRQCNFCGAACDIDKNVCWMCLSQFTKITPYAEIQDQRYEDEISSENSRYDTIFLVLLISCVVVATLLAIGIAIDQPGLLWAYGVLVGPAFLITGARALMQLTTTGDLQFQSLVVSLFASFAITLVAVVLLAVAAVVLLFVMCLSAISR